MENKAAILYLGLIYLDLIKRQIFWMHEDIIHRTQF